MKDPNNNLMIIAWVIALLGVALAIALEIYEHFNNPNQ